MLTEKKIRDFKNALILIEIKSPYRKEKIKFEIFLWLDKSNCTDDLVDYLSSEVKADKKLLDYIITESLYDQFLGDPAFRKFVFQKEKEDK